MKIFKMAFSITIVLLITISILECSTTKMNSATPSITTQRPVKIGVLSYNYNNVFSSLIKKAFEDIQKENEDKVEFTFFDGQSNPAIESEILNNMIQNNYNLILASVVDKNEQEIIEGFVDKAKQKGIPLVFFNIKPAKLDVIKESSKSLIVNPDANEAGELQGKMIADAWNANKQTMDKNNDNIMQYILLKGQLESFPVKERTNSSLKAISDAGIKTEELKEVSANWDQELAKTEVESIFLKYGNRIEAIIANNDSMAIGAIEALQGYGYNKGDKEKNIPVFGINAIPETKDLIENGFMAGTIPQNPRILADAVYTIGMNLVSGKSPLEGTNYKLDKNGAIVTVPIAIPY